MPRPFGYHITGGKNLGSSLYAAVDAGFTSAQIFLGPPQRAVITDFSLPEANLFVKTKKASGIKVYVHAPYVLHAFARPENAIRNNDMVGKAVRVAADLGCDGYVLHMGGTKWYEDGKYMDPYLEPAKKLMDCCGKEALSRCPILFENCASGNHMSGKLQSISLLCDMLNGSGYQGQFGICLDTCHAWAWGYDYQQEDVRSSMVEEIRKYLQLIHLNSAPEKVTCGGHYDRHEALQKGVIKWEAFEALLHLLPNLPVIAEREDFQDILSDWSFVKTADALKEASV